MHRQVNIENHVQTIGRGLCIEKYVQTSTDKEEKVQGSLEQNRQVYNIMGKGRDKSVKQNINQSMKKHLYWYFSRKNKKEKERLRLN